MTTWTPDVCIYHMPCADGFTAAWVVNLRWPGIELVQGVYGNPPPDVTGKHVLIVDFSYKSSVLVEMAQTAASIVILDHHKSAEADLFPFKVDTITHEHKIEALFDMDRSGAMMAWNFCYPDEDVPLLVDHVQDRDLWKFEIPFTRELSAVIFSYDYTMENWNDLDAAIHEYSEREKLVVAGAAIERKHHKDIAELLAITTRSMVIGGRRVPVACLPYTLASDAANRLSKGYPFAACYYDNAQGKRVFSLRSDKDGIDVSLVAASYGGGGHFHASGFTMPNGWEGDSE